MGLIKTKKFINFGTITNTEVVHMSGIEDVVKVLGEKVKGIEFSEVGTDFLDAHIPVKGKIIKVNYNELVTMTEVVISIENPDEGTEFEVCSCDFSYSKEFITDLIVKLIDGVVEEWV